MTNNFSSHRWLITGGCGFIGSNLIAHLLKEYPGTFIRVLDNLSVGRKEDLWKAVHSANYHMDSDQPDLEIVEGDIRDANQCVTCCEGIDIIVHLAANTGVAPSVENPRYDMETNVTGTFNMLEAARRHNVSNFVFASSGATVGEVEPPVHEEKASRPASPYGASKLAGEGYCSAYYQTFGIKTASLRFGNVYGPLSGHKNSVVAKFIKMALSGETLEIYGDGSQTRDFIYIDDLIQAIILAAKSDIGGEAFQIATYRETTVNEIADKIRHLIESETGKEVSVMHGKTRPGDVKRNFSDISKAEQMLGFTPRFNLEKGLEKTLEYFTAAKNHL